MLLVTCIFENWHHNSFAFFFPGTYKQILACAENEMTGAGPSDMRVLQAPAR